MFMDTVDSIGTMDGWSRTRGWGSSSCQDVGTVPALNAALCSD